jgi:hypothetical protein
MLIVTLYCCLRTQKGWTDYCLFKFWLLNELENIFHTFWSVGNLSFCMKVKVDNYVTAHCTWDAEYEFNCGLCEGVKIEDFGRCCCCVVWWTGSNVRRQPVASIFDVVGKGSSETFCSCLPYYTESHLRSLQLWYPFEDLISQLRIFR